MLSDVMYIISNIFRTFLIFKFMKIFFNREHTNIKIELISYIFFIASTSFMIIFISVPAITLTSNIVVLFLVTLNYKDSMLRRILSVVYIMGMLLAVEFISLGIVSALKLIDKVNLDTYNMLLQIAILFVSYIAILIISKYRSVKDGITVPFSQWVALFLIPAITIGLALLPIFTDMDMKSPVLIIIITALFFINILVFYLYDELAKSYQGRLENELLTQQNNAYSKQLEIIGQSQEKIQLLRHDMKNHLIALHSFAKNQDCTGAEKYINNAYSFITSKNEYAKTGNYALDSILNYKAAFAESCGVSISMNLRIPSSVNIYPFDLNAILGNLLDNAITATETAVTAKSIQVDIKYDRGVIFIEISNSFNGQIKMNFKGELQTTHENKSEHGFGICSVRRVVNKYNGKIEFFNIDDKFTVKVMIFDFEAT